MAQYNCYALWFNTALDLRTKASLLSFPVTDRFLTTYTETNFKPFKRCNRNCELYLLEVFQLSFGRHVIAAQQRRQEDLHLEHGQLRADAHAVSIRERGEGVGGELLSRFLGKAVGIEPIGVRKVFRVPLRREQVEDHRRTDGDGMVGDLDLLFHLARYEADRRVEPQGFFDHVI
uniref:Uncharacterized protein n=1 Tax=Timema tahoe TaxID=61484 RepID=A0A7R9FFQ4_9NEOP|nr:unnamed protein product [Timema tahoe]